MSNTLLKIQDLSFSYFSKKTKGEKWIKILSKLNMEVNAGDIIGLVGESGCGKTTLGKLIVDYFSLTGTKYKIEGNILYNHNNEEISIPGKEYSKIKIPPIQMVFQDPRTSLNMRMRVFDQLKESLLLKFKKEKKKATNISKDIEDLTKQFKIRNQLHYTPQKMSGGQRRRFGLAKIMAMNPKLIIADEPVASLDVSIKEQIMDVIFELNRVQNITLIIISHDISLLMRHANKICVIDNGKLVEVWDPSKDPKHESTKNLVDDSNYVNQLLLK